MTGLVLPAKLGGQAGRQAVRVNQVLPNTPAQKVGLRAGDLILRVDELDLSSANHGVEDRQWELIAGIHAIEKFSAYIKFKQPDEKVTLHLLRGDKRMEKEVVLMKFDPPKDLDPEKMKTEFDAFLSEAFLKEWLKKMKLDTKSK